MTTHATGTPTRVATLPAHDEPAVGTVRHEPAVVPTAARRQNLVSWAAVWAGLIVSLAVFLLLEFLFFGLGWLSFSQGSPDGSAGVVTAVLALVAFFVGGVTAGATSMWRVAKGGLLHGILVWALGVVAMVFLSLVGGGAILGSVADVLSQATDIQQNLDLPAVEMEQAVDSAREGARWAVLGLVLPLVTAAAGGVFGGRLGARTSDTGRDAR